MPMGHIEYVEPVVEKSKTDRSEYFKKYYENRQRIILANKRVYYQNKKKLIPQIEVDFTKN